jgi:uncharacterized membrane protein
MACVNHPDRESAARCVTCGAELCDECRIEAGGRNYCSKDVPQSSASSGPVPPTAAAAPTAGVDDPSQEQPAMAALAYIFPVLVPLLILLRDARKSRYMRFHAFQSLFLSLFCFVLGIGLIIVAHVPIIGLIVRVVGPPFLLAVFALAILLAVRAYNKQEMAVPVITQVAADQADRMKV